MGKIASPSPPGNLRAKVLSGFKWMVIGKFFGQFINWGLTFLVMRLLAPSDYGLMAMASMFVAILTLFNEMGMGAALIQAKEIPHFFVRQVWGITLVINISLFFLLFLGAPAVAAFFSEQELVPIVRLLSVQFILAAFILVPQSLLDRDMAFKKKSMIDLFANMVAGLASLLLAVNGYGVWSLVWASLILMGLRSVGYILLTSFFILPVFDFRGMKQVLVFGSQITLEKLIWYLYSQADTLIIGKVLGKEALGFYSVGKHVASLPADKIMPIVNQVIFPAFSRLQDDVKRLGDSIIQGIGMISLVGFAVFWGISCVSQELVSVILGNKWALASLPMMLISLALPLRMANSLFVSGFKAIKRVDICLQNALVPFFLMVPAFWLGCQWSLPGVSLIWPVVYPLCFVLIIKKSCPYFGIRPVQIMRAIVFSFFSGFAMYVGVFGMKYLVPYDFDNVGLLTLLILWGALIYGVFQFVINRRALVEIIEFVRHK